MDNPHIRLPSPIAEIHDAVVEKRQVRLFIKRDDLIHPHISGNKYRKLKYNLAEAKSRGHDSILTFGGAYSNHILATAAAGKIFNFNAIGVIRGEPHHPLNRCLAFAAAQGMRLHYLSRSEYRQKYASETINKLKDEYGDFYLLPEGGSNALAVQGCAEIVSEIDIPFDYLTCSVGTGGTLAGLIAGAPDKRVIGFSSLKGGGFLRDEVARLLKTCDGNAYDNWEIETAYHFGGYAKTSPGLINFMRSFQDKHGIPLDYVYTGKEMYGLYDLIEKGKFPPGSVVLMVHTGGVFNAALSHIN